MLEPREFIEGTKVRIPQFKMMLPESQRPADRLCEQIFDLLSVVAQGEAHPHECRHPRDQAVSQRPDHRRALQDIRRMNVDACHVAAHDAQESEVFVARAGFWE